ncbi:hypothetical protein Tco_1056042 [Tanacetum coccineum]|uniref:Uncharacterized protein n=1 Tax=Tanacetum coccineum TaxID=301880 RepID=A0ABQ5H224_9ASTR
MIERYVYGLAPQIRRMVAAMEPKTMQKVVQISGALTDEASCPRLNRAQGQEENRPNQVTANNGGQGSENQGNQARGRAFMLGAKEALPDRTIVTGLEPSDLGFRYKIEIASGQIVKRLICYKGLQTRE